MKLITVIKMFGLKIVKSSYINTLKQDLDEAISYSRRLKKDYDDARKKITELEEKVRYLDTLVDSLDMDIDSKDSHIVKMGNELSKSRELYNESVKEKETLNGLIWISRRNINYHLNYSMRLEEDIRNLRTRIKSCQIVSNILRQSF